MKKIPSLFMRNYDGDRRVRDEIVAGSEWVASGEGVATRKWDGMAVLIKDGEVFKRYDAKFGRLPPPFFTPISRNSNWNGVPSPRTPLATASMLPLPSP